MWNRNILLLWQGQLVSALGDMVYQVALGFWVLAYTGSTAVMGMVMAAGLLPRVLVSPFAGVLVDRADRRLLLVLMDFIRGMAVLAVALAAFGGWLNIPIIVSAAVIIGLGAAFFDPSVTSTIPGITQKKHLVQVNSLFAMNQTGAGIIGNAVGGVMFATLGAPLLFLINGISYLFSAFSELFLSIPKIEQDKADFHFFSDMKEGLGFIFRNRGLAVLILSALSLNFLLSIGGVLFLPYFNQRTDLGPELYGIAMAVLSAAALSGFLFLIVRKLPPGRQYLWFAVNAILFVLARMTLFSVESYIVIVAQFALFGFSVSQLNSLIGATTQLMVPPHLRGKVFGFVASTAGGLVPLGLALGGILGEFIPIPLIQLITGLLAGLGFLPTLLNRDFREMINRESDAESDERPAEAAPSPDGPSQGTPTPPDPAPSAPTLDDSALEAPVPETLEKPHTP